MNSFLHRAIRLVSFYLLMMLSAIGQAPSTLNSGNTLLWEISGKGIQKPSWLFGTFHLLCKEDIQFSDQLKDALLHSRYLYLELDMDDPSVLLGMMDVMNMKNGKTLSALFAPPEWERLNQFFKDSLKMNLQAFSRCKPSLLEAMLYPKFMQCKQMSGVEDELMKLAKKTGAEIKGLETISFQASVFDSIPYDVQARQLLLDIDSFASQKNNFIKLMNLYKNQDIDGLQKAIDEDQSTHEINDVLIGNRNRNWVETLRTVMLNDNIFIAVGAGHLVGDQGLIALLRKNGFTVKPVRN